MSLKVICAWCGRVLRDGSDDSVSHGICPACRAAATPLHRRLRALVETLDRHSAKPTHS